MLEFPTPFTYKVMGLRKPELVDQVVEVYSAMRRVTTLRQ
ncbi:DUF493 family protein [Enterobacter cloacae subsp. cloacae]|nr:DUF493 family protein [Enterobacter cloacae subsp. cloacae]